jgi:hypothetical protein
MASPTLQVKRGLFVNLPALRAGEPGFTTDQYDLYLGTGAGTTASNQFYGSSRYWTRENATNAAEFKFVDKDGTNGVSLRAPAVVTTPVTYTLPEGGATQGHFLRLGSAGALEWASVTAGASFTGATLTDTTFSGISTFSGAIDANAGLDVTGGSTFDSISVTGVGTIATADINGGNIDNTVIGSGTASAGTFTQLNYSNSSTSGISTVGSLYLGADEILTAPGGTVTLSNIDAIDAVTKATLEASLALDPNDFNSLNVSGISTIGGLLDANGGLDVTGQTTLNTGLNVTSGVSTFAGLVDANAGLDVTGHTALNNTLAVTGVSTFTGAINANGGVVGNVTGDLTGVASTATKLQTARNFEISGDVVATAVSFDGTGNVNLVAEIQANSVGLGTDTFGDYVAGVTGTANQISVSGSGGETAAVVLSLPDDVVVGTSLSVPTVKTATVQHSNGTEAITIDVGGNVGVSTNLTVSGNLVVNGTTTQVNTTELTVEDTLIELGFVNGAAPTGDFDKDLGLLFNYFSGSPGSAKKAAVYWDESDAKMTFASEVSEANSVLTASAYATILAGGLEINNGCTEGATTVISCVGNELALSNIVVDGGSF